VSVGPRDGVEALQLTAAVRWIDSGGEPCRRVNPMTRPQHLVSYFACTDDSRLPTGGHVEPGEPPRATVLREAREELGIDARVQVRGAVAADDRRHPGPVRASHGRFAVWYVLALEPDEACERGASTCRAESWLYSCTGAGPFFCSPLPRRMLKAWRFAMITFRDPHRRIRAPFGAKLLEGPPQQMATARRFVS
jgi:8-oxo-dGTP pyrophosphatase MutT (NUDIX family)